MRSTNSRRRERGVTLLELMIAMGVLAFGLLAMWRLHVVGLTSNSAARRNTSAVAIAQELVSGLERLPFGDTHLSATSTSTDPPSDFGPLVQGDGSIATPSGLHVWSDTTPVPGVRSNGELRERQEAGTDLERRWLVWSVPAVSSSSGKTSQATKLVMVSVTWSDPGFQRPREVVLYSQVSNAAIIQQNAAGDGGNAWTRGQELATK